MQLDHDERARIDFVLTLRRRWADTAYPALRSQYERRVGEEAPGTWQEAMPAIRELPGHPWFAWLERGSQKMLWRAVSDVVARHPRAAPADPGDSTVEVDPEFELPRWYTDWDIHVQPGGVWSDDAAADIYELGAQLVMLGVNDDYTFHRAFTETAIPDGDYRRIIDFGCGFGKSTWPLKRRFPEAEVIGVDLAAPCLDLAKQRTDAQGLAVTYKQADCTATELEAGSFDLVTSTMLLHELPRPQLEATWAEAARLLKPGGRVRFLDFSWTREPFRDTAVFEHGERNNEPFMPGAMSADSEAIAARHGLANVRLAAFDERGKGHLGKHSWPERDEWHFPWTVIEAEKPEAAT